MTAPKTLPLPARDWALESWSTAEIVYATGATLRRVQWADERHIVSPGMVGHRREYDWRSAVHAIVLFAMVDHGVPLKIAGKLARKIDVAQLWKDPTCWLLYGGACRIRGQHYPALLKLFRSKEACELIALASDRTSPSTIVSIEAQMSRLLNIKQLARPEARRILSRVKLKNHRYMP